MPQHSNKEWDWLESEPHQIDVQASDFKSGAVSDGVEGIGVVPSVPDQPEGSGTLVSGQISYEKDHTDPDGGLVVGMFPQDPAVDVCLIFSSCLPLFPDQEWDWPENKLHQNDVQFSDLHPVGAHHEVESGAKNGVEDIGLVSDVPDQPERSEAMVSGQILQEPDDARINGGLAAGLVLKDPADDDHSIRSSCLPLFPDQEWGWPENESPKNDIQVSDLHPLGADHEMESEAETDGIEVIELVPHVPKIQSVGTNLLESECPGKDGKGESSFAQKPDCDASVSVSPGAGSNVRKRRGRPTKHPEFALNIPIHPKHATVSRQTLPRLQSTQHSGSVKETRGLPDGWITEEKFRKIGKSAGHKDKTYIEAITNKRCRSIPDIWRYIEKKR